jgi:hypothetical protein
VLPPVLEIYVVWHPGDTEGGSIAQTLLDHFRGTAFSGLIGGAVEVYIRSVSSTDDPDGIPRPLPCTEPLPYEVAPPALTAVVLVAGVELASDIENNGQWYGFIEAIASARRSSPDTVGVFTVCTADNALDGTVLQELVGDVLGIAHGTFGTETFEEALCRDLAQGIAQMGDREPHRVTVFVSHTKRLSTLEEATVSSLVDLVRAVIATTRLAEFFDARDLQPNEDWAPALIAAASTGALLAVRTDLYSSRPWCQREVLTAKRVGMPVVILDALTFGEERGSFLMDHVPRSPGRQEGAGWRPNDIIRALGKLVDECLKRVLWRKQQQIADDAGLPVTVDWWAPHAPEPATFAAWIEERDDALRGDPIVVLHPDPPLGPDEREVLMQIAHLASLNDQIEFLTPRGLAARGG